MKTLLALAAVLAVGLFATTPVRGRDLEMSVALRSSTVGPVPVGVPVTWTAETADISPGTLWYRFRVRRSGGDDYRMVRDFGPENTLIWAASDREGAYEIESAVRNVQTGETATTSALYEVTSRALEGAPVVSPTTNPIVFLYSAPPCPAGSNMRVSFRSPEGSLQFTPRRSCNEGVSMNFYLAGLRAETTYSVQHFVDDGSAIQSGPPLAVTTPPVSLPIAKYTVLHAPVERIAEGVLLQSTIFEVTVATDLNGNLIWYYPGNISSLTRPEPGGLFLGIRQVPGGDPSQQVLREFDAAGITTRETNAARINEQLALLGIHPIGAFHHEALPLPNGGILTLASTERILTDIQGPGPADVVGDMILALDRDLQVVWAWDSFDHLDPHRSAILGELCPQAGCPPIYQAAQGTDWLHGNSLQLTPDGNILYSVRHQDWLIKIDYNQGLGSGGILWRLGKDGDFQIDSTDPYPWFSHQHDAQFVGGDNSTLALYDNGNTRQANDPAAHSRGQVLQLDEVNRTARLLLNADLGAFSFALGAAQKLPNGNYHFDTGWLDGNASQSVEVDPLSERIVYAIQVETPAYRTFRMRDLYTP